MSGGNSHLALRMVKEGKWMCEKTLKVLLSLKKWTENYCGRNLLIKPSLGEKDIYGGGSTPGDGIINLESEGL
jgi:hypothetical protein